MCPPEIFPGEVVSHLIHLVLALRCCCWRWPGAQPPAGTPSVTVVLIPAALCRGCWSRRASHRGVACRSTTRSARSARAPAQPAVLRLADHLLARRPRGAGALRRVLVLNPLAPLSWCSGRRLRGPRGSPATGRSRLRRPVSGAWGRGCSPATATPWWSRCERSDSLCRRAQGLPLAGRGAHETSRRAVPPPAAEALRRIRGVVASTASTSRSRRRCGRRDRANGSGKSTLLKLASGILRPTSARSRRRRVTALIELGAGFHPEITGRENVVINGMLLGCRARGGAADGRDRRLRDLGPFIDSRLKTYSSGMYVRLGFAVGVGEPDILLIDEVLAVVTRHSRRGLDRLARMRRRGVTMVLVSHDSTGEPLRDARSTAQRADRRRRRARRRDRALPLRRRRRRSGCPGSAAPVRVIEEGRRWGNGDVEILRVTVSSGGVEQRLIPSGAPCAVHIATGHRPVEDFVFGSPGSARRTAVGGHNNLLDGLRPRRLARTARCAAATMRWRSRPATTNSTRPSTAPTTGLRLLVRCGADPGHLGGRLARDLGAAAPLGGRRAAVGVTRRVTRRARCDAERHNSLSSLRNSWHAACSISDGSERRNAL